MTLQPIGDNLVLKIEIKKKESTTSKGLLLLNEGTEQSLRMDIAEIIAVGEGRTLNNGEILKPKVSVGDKVIYNKFSGVEINTDTEKFLIVKEADILAKIS